MNLIIYDFFYFWLITSIFFLLMEMGSPGLFYFLSFCFGGLLAAIVALWSDLIFVQVIFFFVGSVCAMLILRHVVMPLLSKGRPHERTNVYAVIGKRVFVVQEITKQQPGFVIIEGSQWVARPIGGESIAVGHVVEVLSVHGAHVVVKKV